MRYEVLIQGFVLNPPQPAQQGLMMAFGVDAATAKRVFAKFPCVVKRGVTLDEAQTFEAVLRSIGARVLVRPEASDTAEAPPAAVTLPAREAPPAPGAAGSAARSMPAPGASEPARKRGAQATMLFGAFPAQASSQPARVLGPPEPEHEAVARARMPSLLDLPDVLPVANVQPAEGHEAFRPRSLPAPANDVAHAESRQYVPFDASLEDEMHLTPAAAPIASDFLDADLGDLPQVDPWDSALGELDLLAPAVAKPGSSGASVIDFEPVPAEDFGPAPAARGPRELALISEPPGLGPIELAMERPDAAPAGPSEGSSRSGSGGAARDWLVRPGVVPPVPPCDLPPELCSNAAPYGLLASFAAPFTALSVLGVSSSWLLGLLVGGMAFAWLGWWLPAKRDAAAWRWLSRGALASSRTEVNSPSDLAFLRSYERWTKVFGLELVRVLDLSPTRTARSLAVYRHVELPLFLLLRLAGSRASVELWSVLGRGALLVTADTSRDRPLPAGHLMQTYPQASLRTLWQRHLQAHDALLEQLKPKPVPAPDFDAVFLQVVKDQLDVFERIPHWTWRLPLWRRSLPKRFDGLGVLEARSVRADLEPGSSG